MEHYEIKTYNKNTNEIKTESYYTYGIVEAISLARVANNYQVVILSAELQNQEEFIKSL